MLARIRAALTAGLGLATTTFANPLICVLALAVALTLGDRLSRVVVVLGLRVRDRPVGLMDVTAAAALTRRLLVSCRHRNVHVALNARSRRCRRVGVLIDLVVSVLTLRGT